MAKETGNEKKFLIVIGILAGLLIAIMAMVSLSHPKPYFNVDGITVTPMPLEGTNRTYYSFPISFVIGSTLYNEGMLVKVDPRKLENVTVSVNRQYFLSREPIVILFDPEAPPRIVESMYEIKRVGRILNMQLGMAITHESNESENRNVSVLNCNDTLDGMRILYLNGNATETRVYEDGCIKIEAPGYDELEKATDAFIWQWMLAIKVDNK